MTGLPQAVAELPEAAVAELFARQVRATPEAVAVVAGGAELTYAELDLQANLLAWALIRQGVRPETPVAVMLDRSAELVVAILAIIKAGGAYVPLDSRFPSSRIELILQETGAALVLNQDVLTALIQAEPDSSGVEVPWAVTHRDVVGLALTPEWRGGGHERVLMPRRPVRRGRRRGAGHQGVDRLAQRHPSLGSPMETSTEASTETSMTPVPKAVVDKLPTFLSALSAKLNPIPSHGSW
ncbi:AMP-binding protein [Kitasatospora sp. NPDC001159]